MVKATSILPTNYPSAAYRIDFLDNKLHQEQSHSWNSDSQATECGAETLKRLISVLRSSREGAVTARF